MDWTRSEMQTAIGDLTKQVLRSSEVPWVDLAGAGLAEVDDMLDLVTLLEQVGRAGGRVPALETFVLGAPARRAGDAAGIILTGVPRYPVPDVENGSCSATFDCVPSAGVARRLVFQGSSGLFAVELDDCTVTPQHGTNGDDLGCVVLDDAPVRRLGGLGDAHAWVQRCEVGVCALLYGLAREALIMTARYTSTREQFGRPIATFQAVSQRAADAWIQLNAMELTLTQAAWRVQQGHAAHREVAIARIQASEGAHAILAAAQHLHGGHGFDKDYALHRYFLTVKAWEFSGGGAPAYRTRLGELLAADCGHSG